jgi:hypothetical protein
MHHFPALSIFYSKNCGPQPFHSTALVRSNMSATRQRQVEEEPQIEEDAEIVARGIPLQALEVFLNHL